MASCPKCGDEVQEEQAASTVIVHRSGSHPHVVGCLDGELKTANVECGKCHGPLKVGNLPPVLFEYGVTLVCESADCNYCTDTRAWGDQQKMQTFFAPQPAKFGGTWY